MVILILSNIYRPGQANVDTKMSSFSLYMFVSSRKILLCKASLDKACDIWDCTDRILLLNVSIWYLSANWILFWQSQENSWKCKWLAMTPILTLLSTPRSLVRSGGSALLEFSVPNILTEMHS